MAEVIAATYGADTPQEDGRAYVTEVFVISGGAVRTSTYLAEVAEDLEAHLAVMRAAINAELAEPEG